MALWPVARSVVDTSARLRGCLLLADTYERLTRRLFGPARFQVRPPSSNRLYRSALVLLLGLATIPHAAFAQTASSSVRISDDRGGNIGQYWSRYMAVRDSGKWVVIDGTCTSACTMVLGIVPYDRICVTSNAVLGFHAAWRPGFLGFKVINEPATQTLLRLYPPAIRQWIARHGGLGTDMMYLSGSELLAIYHECR